MLPAIGYSLPARATDLLSDATADAFELTFHDAADQSQLASVPGRLFGELANLHLGDLSLDEDVEAWCERHRAVGQFDPAIWGRSLSMTLQIAAPAMLADATLEKAIGLVRKLQGRFAGSRLLLDVASPVKDTASPIRESEFLSELLRRTGCGWRLDVAEMFGRSRNLSFDPYDQIAEILPSATQVVLRVSSARYEKRIGAFVTSAEGAIPDEVWSLVRHTLMVGGHKTKAVLFAGRELKGSEKARGNDLRHARFLADRVQGRQRMLRQQPVLAGRRFSDPQQRRAV